MAAVPARTGWGAAANPSPWCLSMLGQGFWGSPHPLGSPRAKLGVTLGKGLGMWAATHGRGFKQGRWATGPLYLETVISVWGPCAFSRPSLVKMPTSTMMATTPQMM